MTPHHPPPPDRWAPGGGIPTHELERHRRVTHAADPDDPARLAHPELCNHRWGAMGLHLCDEPVDHSPYIAHRCRCGGSHPGILEPVDQPGHHWATAGHPRSYPDQPWGARIDVGRWLFPRLTLIEDTAGAVWNFLGFCWEIFRYGSGPK